MPGPDPAFAASQSSQSSLSGRFPLQSGVGFTPGPWHVCKTRGGALTVLVKYPDGNPRKHVADICWGVSEGGEPDAHLIAAAPELYEALDIVARWISADGAELEPDDEAKIYAALAKARGEQ